MADSEFVEEFDTDSDEGERPQLEIPSKRARFSESAEHFSINPQLNYNQWYSQGWSGQTKFQYPANSSTVTIPSPYVPYNNVEPEVGHYEFPESFRDVSNAINLNAINPNDESSEDSKPQKLDKKRHRRKLSVRLSDYDEQVKTQAWKIYEEKTLQKSLEKVTDKEDLTKIKERLKEIQKEQSTIVCLEENKTTINKIVNKIRNQRRKRAREKALKIARSKQKKTAKELSNIRNKEIDKWLEEQKIKFDILRQQEQFVQEAKKSLFEVMKKKQVIEERIKLLFTLQKLRDVRKKQMLNTRKGFDSSSTSDGTFSSGISLLTKKAEKVLSQVKEEENMIRVMSNVEVKQTIIVPEEEDTSLQKDRLKFKRDRKWQKYLRKKYLNSLHSSGIYQEGV